MASLAANLVLASPGSNWTKIILIAIFTFGLVLVVILPFTIDVVNAHKSWRTIVGADPAALKVLKGPNGIQGLARATMALSLLVAIGFALGYILVEHPFSDNKPIVTAIVSSLTTAFAAVTAFYFSTRAMQGATEAATATATDPATGTGSETAGTTELAITVNTPTDGQAFTQNDAVNADYSVAPSTGAQITKLKGSVDSGAPLDTATIGTFPFTVTTKDSAGKEKDVAYTYTVNAAPPGP